LKRHLQGVHSKTFLQIQNYQLSAIKEQIEKSEDSKIAEDNLPFRTLDSPNVRRIFDPLCDGIAAKTGESSFRVNEHNIKEALSRTAKKSEKSSQNYLQKISDL
jgi:hypothetical protein